MIFRLKPGLGWLWVMCAYLSLAGLLFWVNHPPKNAELLHIEHLLQQGILPSTSQRSHLFEALHQYPLWSQEWNGTQTHLLGSAWSDTQLSSDILVWRASKAPLNINISGANHTLKTAVKIDIQGYSKSSAWQEQKLLSIGQTLTLPATDNFPELLKISTETPLTLHWSLL